MKCKYCQAEIEQDAQFCTNCGKDLSKFPRCIKCGEILDDGSEFCPYCGTKQLQIGKDVEKTTKKEKKYWYIGFAFILLAIIGGLFLYFQGKEGTHELAKEAETYTESSNAKEATVKEINFEDIIVIAKELFTNKEQDEKNSNVLESYGIKFLYKCRKKYENEPEEDYEFYGKDAEVRPTSNDLEYISNSSHGIIIKKKYGEFDICFANGNDYWRFVNQAHEYGLVHILSDGTGYYIVKRNKIPGGGIVEKDITEAYEDAVIMYKEKGKRDEGWFVCNITDAT